MPRRRHAALSLPMASGLAGQAASLATSVPFVMGTRLARMATMGNTPSAADQTEFTRMFSEKAAAAMESGWAMAWSLAQAQQRFWMASASLWFTPWTAGSVQRLTSRSGQAAFQQMLNKGLRPFTRRAAANAVRLRRRRSGK